MAETAAGSEEPVVEQPAAGGADQPGQDLHNQDGEALGDGKVIEGGWVSTVTLLIVGRGGCFKHLGLLGHGRAD